MSFSYHSQKLEMISASGVAMSLILGLLLIQYTHGITEEQRQANREKYAGLIEEDIRKQDNSTQDNRTTECVDQNLCGTPSPWHTERQKVVSPIRLWCVLQGGYYYEDNGEPHCITH